MTLNCVGEIVSGYVSGRMVLFEALVLRDYVGTLRGACAEFECSLNCLKGKLCARGYARARVVPFEALAARLCVRLHFSLEPRVCVQWIMWMGEVP